MEVSRVGAWTRDPREATVSEDQTRSLVEEVGRPASPERRDESMSSLTDELPADLDELDDLLDADIVVSDPVDGRVDESMTSLTDERPA